MADTERRYCPSCSFVTLLPLIDQARIDLTCPRCGMHKICDFVPEADPFPPKPGNRKAA
jgi:ribosomal protein S27AE